MSMTTEETVSNMKHGKRDHAYTGAAAGENPALATNEKERL